MKSDFFDEGYEGDDDFIPDLSEGDSSGPAAPAHLTVVRRPPGAAKIRVKPMPEAVSQKFPGITSMVCTFEGGRQIIYLQKRKA